MEKKTQPTTVVVAIGELHLVVIATTGYCGKSLYASSLVSDNTRIIDSGATNHMKFDSKQIAKIKSSLEKFVSTANAKKLFIVSEGSLKFTETLNWSLFLFFLPWVITSYMCLKLQQLYLEL